jgi:hypothetical protein
MRQPATGITQNLGNRNRKKDRTAVRFSSVLWIFLVHRTEPANTNFKVSCFPKQPAEDSGSANEDNVDEKLQVVVLKKGEHLTEHEAENVRQSGEFTLI